MNDRDVTDYPAFSQLFEEHVRQQHIEQGFDPERGLTLVNEFLVHVPYYPEALLFKARMLIVLRRYAEALAMLTAAKNIDEWRVVYAFDEAEVLYKSDQKLQAIHTIQAATEYLLREALDGMKNFLVGIDVIGEERNDVLRSIRQEMIRFLSEDASSLNFDAILPFLQEHTFIEWDAEE